jgi:hypothetical protein
MRCSKGGTTMRYRKFLGGIAAIVAAAGLSLFAIGPQPAGAQTLSQRAQQAMQALGVPCNAYSSGLLECAGYNSDNVHMHLRVHTSVADPDPTTLDVFDPYTGHSSHFMLSEDGAGNAYLVGVDSELGFIDTTSGWLSVFYPYGNPYSAAVHSPVNYYAGMWGGGSTVGCSSGEGGWDPFERRYCTA